MRLIGSIPDETDAKRFGDYLLAAGMRNSVEEGSSGWAVWVEHDDHLDAAKTELETFRANPGDAKYNGASRKAEKIRSAEEKKQERLQKLHHDVRTSWGSTRQWAQPVTIGLILLSLLAAAATAVGKNDTGPAMNALRIQSVETVDAGDGHIQMLIPREPLHDVRRGQVWRLITPIFLHFGPIHLIFNMFWLFDLGGQIERARGSLFLAGLVLAGAVAPNLAEYVWSGPLFGGMSGVVYALFGYVWIKGKYEPHLNMGVSQQTVLILMIWLVICMIGIMGANIANAAHLVGLIVGVVMAYGPIEYRRMRRRLRSSPMMRTSVRALCFCAMLVLGGLVPARGEITTYANPLDVIIADPFVLRDGDTYYLYGTTDARLGFQVFTSGNLIDWRARGFAFRKDKSDFGQRHFWAPETFEHKGRFYLHYTASSKEFSQRIVLAEGESPLGPFREVKAPWFQSKLCIIDSHVFEDTDGQLYLYYVLDCSENGDSEIYVRKVSDDLVVSKDAEFCAKPSQSWEGTQWNEAPFIFKRGDTYVMTYSANCYIDTFYNIGYATAPSPLGPWTKASENPILRHTNEVKGPGHNAFIESPDGKELYIVYHTQQLLTGGPKRHLALDRVRVIEEPGKLPRLVVDGPSMNPRPLPSGAKVAAGASDEFSGESLGGAWTTFNEWRPNWKLDGGFLAVKTQDGDVFEERTDLANLFLQYAPAGDFTITTRVDFTPHENYQHASLYVWQDHNHYVKLALVHDHGLRLEAAREIGGKYEKRLADATDERFLRIRKTGQTLTFHVSRDGKEWRQLEASFDVKFHDVKVGIAAGSPAAKSAEAKFDFFRIETDGR